MVKIAFSREEREPSGGDVSADLVAGPIEAYKFLSAQETDRIANDAVQRQAPINNGGIAARPELELIWMGLWAVTRVGRKAQTSRRLL